MSFQQELATAREYGITPVVLATEILPLIHRARNVSMTFPHYLSADGVHTPSKSPRFKRTLRKYMRRHNLDSTTLKADDAHPIYFFTSESKDNVYSALQEIERRQKDRRFQYQIVEMEGKLLGYPECCINAQIEDRKRYAGLEDSRITRQLLGNWVINSGSEICVKSDILPAFFTNGFWPCKPDCEHAMKIGNRILDSMQGEEYEAYSRAVLNYVLSESLGVLWDARKNPDKFIELSRRFIENEPLLTEVSVRLI